MTPRNSFKTILNTRADFGDLLAEKNMLDVAVEVGVAEGRYSLGMLKQWGLKKLYLVDLWDHVDGMKAELGATQEKQESIYQDCLVRLEDYLDQCVFLRGWSHEMANQVPDNSVGFVHIDATHYHEWVLKDLKAWYPKLRVGGIMSGHDYLNPALTVKSAVDEFTKKLGITANTLDENRPNDACFWFEKP